MFVYIYASHTHLFIVSHLDIHSCSNNNRSTRQRLVPTPYLQVRISRGVLDQKSFGFCFGPEIPSVKRFLGRDIIRQVGIDVREHPRTSSAKVGQEGIPFWLQANSASDHQDESDQTDVWHRECRFMHVATKKNNMSTRV